MKYISCNRFPFNSLMTQNIQFQAVIFDMDGLMFDTERLGLEAFQHAALHYGYADTRDIFLKMIGRNVVDADQIMREAFGDSFPIDDVRQERHNYLERLRKTMGLPVKSGLLDLLSFLEDQDVPLAVASSSSRNIVEENIRNAQIDHYFQQIICGDEVQKGKPDPEIFLKAAAKLKIDHSLCVVLEDSAPGIRAAYTAEMIPIMVPDILQPTPEIAACAHRIFSSLFEVQKYLSFRTSEPSNSPVLS